MDRLISIGEAAALKGVTVETIRRWEKAGEIQSERTDGGHRRYRLSQFVELKPGRTIAYARVSTHDQKPDLDRQALVLSVFCESHQWNYELIQDLGSGLNYKKKGLRKLIKSLIDEDIARLVITDKDRLLRFGSELIFSICEHKNIEVVILNQKENTSYEEDLAQDVLEIITVFAARLYGSRSHKNAKIIEKLAESVNVDYNEEVSKEKNEE